VWKSSSEFGIGRAQTKSGKWLVVANYHPAGNFVGRYKENVPPPKSGKVELPKKEEMPTEAGSIRPMSEGDQITSTGTQTSIRKEITTKADGTKVIKTIVTETKIGADGKKTTTTRETVTEGSDGGASDPKKNKGQKVKSALCCGRPRKGEKGKKTQSMKQFIDEVVKFHNKYRKIHGKVGDLKHNKELSVLAQSWAERMAATSALGHSNNIYKGKEVGENVATKWSSQGAEYLGSEVVDQWFKESDKYDFSGDFQQGTGHFTQVVWKNSKEIGVGKAYSKDGRVFVVCNYHPAGNVLTTFKDNVFPASKK